MPVVLLKGECSSMFLMPTNPLSSTWNSFRYVRQKVVTYVHLIFTLERTRQDVCKLHKFWIQAVQQQNLLWGLWIQYTFWTKGITCIWTIFMQIQNFMRNFFCSMYACGTVCPNRKGLPKAVTTAKLKKTNCFQMQWSTVGYKMVWQKGSHSFDHNTCCCPCGNKQNRCTGE